MNPRPFATIWEEDRIFLFIDLNKSTYFSEQLSNIRYSELISTCLADLQPFISKFEATLYQVTGDEVVLTWHGSEYRNAVNAVRLFFEYTDYLIINKNTYRKKFGLLPTFKAAVNAGSVAVTSDHRYADEPIYRGSTLNTCGGLIKLCSALDKPLLATQSFVKVLGCSSGIGVDYHGRYMVKGKTAHENIYSILRTD